MSFDLYFCSETPRQSVFESLWRLVEPLDCFAVNDDAQQICYHDPLTGAYFSFDYSAPEDHPDEGPLLPTGHYYTGLSFNLNYNRPSFFAQEAFPWVERIAGELGYSIVDPQEAGSPEIQFPRAWRAADLVASWEQNNSWAVRTLHGAQGEEVDYRYVPRAQSLGWWSYTKQKDELQSKLGEEIFVPSLAILQKGGDSLLRTAVVWSDAIPQVFPPCDLVVRQMLRRNRRGKLVSKSMQVIGADEVLDKLGSLAQPLPATVPGLKVLSPAQASEIRAVFDKLSGPKLEGYQGVAPDEYVDVLVPEKLSPTTQ